MSDHACQHGSVKQEISVSRTCKTLTSPQRRQQYLIKESGEVAGIAISRAYLFCFSPCLQWPVVNASVLPLKEHSLACLGVGNIAFRARGQSLAVLCAAPEGRLPKILWCMAA